MVTLFLKFFHLILFYNIKQNDQTNLFLSSNESLQKEHSQKYK